MKIGTARGHEILADEEDRLLLLQYSWHVVKAGSGRLYAYARIKGTKRRISMHRLLMEPPQGMVVHHKNNDGLDNRRANLEVATNRQNIRYAFDCRDVGVHFHKQTGKWRAQLRDDTGKFVSLGLHKTKEAALAAAKEFRS